MFIVGCFWLAFRLCRFIIGFCFGVPFSCCTDSVLCYGFSIWDWALISTVMVQVLFLCCSIAPGRWLLSFWSASERFDGCIRFALYWIRDIFNSSIFLVWLNNGCWRSLYDLRWSFWFIFILSYVHFLAWFDYVGWIGLLFWWIHRQFGSSCQSFGRKLWSLVGSPVFCRWFPHFWPWLGPTGFNLN